MNLLDEQYTKTPFYGVRNMTTYLRSLGYALGKDHVRTLLRKMGLCAIFPKPNLSKPHPDNRIYPYLLRDLEVTRPNQVWCADITYIRLSWGFAYLVAVVDWYSRYVLSWRLSNTLGADFCVEALQEAVAKYGTPDVLNTDQGTQFTSEEFIGVLTSHGISISMDGRGRCLDNVFVERIWRSVKYENVYLKGYQTIPEARAGLTEYFEFYNRQRFHQGLDNKTPWQVYCQGIIGGIEGRPSMTEPFHLNCTEKLVLTNPTTSQRQNIVLKFWGINCSANTASCIPKPCFKGFYI
jgi:putative transposase